MPFVKNFCDFCEIIQKDTWVLGLEKADFGYFNFMKLIKNAIKLIK